MSTNIISIECQKLDARISVDALERLIDEYEDELPEGCFLIEIEDRYDRGFLDADANGEIKLLNLWWYGERSGRAWDLLVKVVAPEIRGEVEAVFTWEGGNPATGLKIKDGEVTECDVVMTLVPKRGAK